jgi:hypothetical protein
LENYLPIIEFLARVDDFSEIIVCARARPDANRQPQQICLAPSVFGYWLQVKQCVDFSTADKRSSTLMQNSKKTA